MDAVIYARLSQEDPNPRPGEATATARQIADCRAHAERQGWRVVDVFEDPDHSASDTRRKRPAFERMLASLGDGLRADVVLAWKLDRLLRHPKEAERIIDLADAREFAIITLNDPGIDLTNPDGRYFFRSGVALAKRESETMGLRIRRKARELAESGRPNGGGIRSFGLTPDKSTIVEPEAAMIRDAARRIIAGESVHSIVIDWNRRGVRTPGRARAPEGRRWEVSSLKRMLTAPRIVGDRSHHGVVVAAGSVPAILDRETWERLCALLTARKSGGTEPRVRKHYLTGLAVCGLCGVKLIARPDYRGVTRYVCGQPRGCGGITVKRDNIEPLIAAAIAARLDSPEFRAATATAQDDDTADLAGQLNADQAALAELTRSYFVDREITKPEYQVARAALAKRIDEAERRLTTATTTATAGRLAGVDVLGEWDAHDAAWRHETAAALIERVIVNRAPRRGTRFDPLRVDVEWRT